ncbi:MAG: conjugal transfer protein [Lachnospiraceae bacterium]|nr:conjugal transfer protein [Lachnospiraceae bacterium]
MESEWLLCPRCQNKTRIKIRPDTTLEKFPLFCPKCKLNVLISFKNAKLNIVGEPDAKT